MIIEQPVTVVEVAWRPANDVARAALIQLLFGAHQEPRQVAPITVIGTARVGGRHVQPRNIS